MTQHTFAADNPASLTNLDANFAELYQLRDLFTVSGTTVGLGGSTGGNKFEVGGNIAAIDGAAARRTAVFVNTGGQLYVGVESSSGGAVFTNAGAYAGVIGTASATSLSFSTSAIQRAIIDAAGAVGLGTDTPLSPLHLNAAAGASAMRFSDTTNGTYGFVGQASVLISGGASTDFAIRAEGAFAIRTNGASGAERFRVDASGNAMLGTTSSTAPNPGVALLPAGTIHIGNSAAATGFTFQSFQRSATAIGSITQSGTTAVLYNTTSDARLKTNIVDASDAGGVIDAIKVRAFDWRSEPDEHTTHGFVAQELAQHAPQAVKVGDLGEEVTDAWAVDPSKLVALLVKEIQSLRARVAALETP